VFNGCAHLFVYVAHDTRSPIFDQGADATLSWPQRCRPTHSPQSGEMCWGQAEFGVHRICRSNKYKPASPARGDIFCVRNGSAAFDALPAVFGTCTLELEATRMMSTG
jgi:hypothetical protein